MHAFTDFGKCVPLRRQRRWERVLI